MNARLARLLFVLLPILTTLSLAAAGRPLAPRTLGPTSYHVANPVTAYAGGRFLTVWRESMGVLGDHLRGAFSDANGVRLSPSSFAFGIPPVSDLFAYQVVAAGDSFVLFWRDAEDRTHMADVDSDGRLANERTIELPDYIFPRYSWNGTHFLAVLTRPGANSAVVAMFDRDGRIVLPSTPIPGSTHATDIAVADGRFIAVTGGWDSVAAQEVTPQGLGTRRMIEMYASSHTGARPSRVAAAPLADGGVLVVWSTAGQQSAELKSAIVRRDGTVAAQSLLLTGTTPLAPLAVLRSENGYLVAYTMDGNATVEASLSTLRLDATGARAGEPVVASNLVPVTRSAAASPSVILIPYPAEIGGPSNIFTFAIAADGQARPPELLSIFWSRQLQPVLGAGGGDVLATWTEIAGNTAVVRAAALDGDGEPVGEPVHVADGVLAATETAGNEARSVFEDVHHLVIYRDGNRLLARRVAAGATVVDATPIVLADLAGTWSADAGVVWVDSRWVVVWSDGRALRSLTVSRDGIASDARTLDVHAPIEEGFIRLVGRPQLAYDGGEVLLVWQEAQRHPDEVIAEPPAKTWAIRLTRTGVPFDPQPLDLDVEGPSLSVASGGFDFMVVVGQHARVLKGDGPLRVTAARELFGWPAVSDVAWDDVGDDYAVALRYYGGLSDWYLAELGLDGNANSGGAWLATATLQPDVEAAPSIVATSSRLIGVQEGTVADGVSATVYRHPELAFMPPPPGAPRNVRVRPLSSGEVELTWDPPAVGEASSYVVEQLLGTWHIIGRIPGDTLRFRFIAYGGLPPEVRVRAFNIGGPSAPEGGTVTVPKRRRAVR